jgi:hypothetical protein
METIGSKTDVSPQSGSIQIKEKKKKKTKKERLDRFDSRGVQTLFRTLSRNHYNLLRMVDSKASIVLTVNSIIISLLMGAIYVVPASERINMAFGAKILINFSMLSMIFALISMLPHRYFGAAFSKSKYRGSLYAGNFSSQSLEDFQKEIDRVMESGSSVYKEMTVDLYFLGVVINAKQRLLWFAVVVFLLGLIAAMIFSLGSGIELWN